MGELVDLKNNAVFQLSLSSKELFHSNFLYWLATSQPTIFNELLNKLNIVFQLDLKNHVVCREYNHFDFCICEKVNGKDPNDSNEEYQNNATELGDDKSPAESSDSSVAIGKVLLVLENKFKSIATKEQLDRYKDVVEKCEITTNIKGKTVYNWGLNANAIWRNKSEKNCKKKNFYSDEENKNQCSAKYVLLTLSSDFPDKVEVDNEGKWKIITYADYAAVLDKTQNTVKDVFTKELISKYQSFISNFSTYIAEELNDNWNRLTWKDMVRKELIDLRINDIWQKLIVSKFLTNFLHRYTSCSDLDHMTNNSSKIYKGYYYGTAGASICIHVPFIYQNKPFLYHISIQGCQYRRGIQWKDGGDCAQELVTTKESPFSFSNNQYNLWKNGSTNGKKEFNSFKGAFTYYYKYRKMNEGCKFQQIATCIEKDVESFIEWGKCNDLVFELL